MSRSQLDRFNLNNYRQSAVRPPVQIPALTVPSPMASLSPVDAREDMDAANSFLEARFREARDVPTGGTMVGAPRGTETELHERRRSTGGVNAYPHPGSFPQGNPNQTRAEAIELAPRRVPESVQAFRQSHEYQREQKRTSTSSGQLQQQQIQQQQQQQQYYLQHQRHMSRRQSSPNEHHLQHPPQLPPPAQHHSQVPAHHAQHPHTAPVIHAPAPKHPQAHVHPAPAESNMFQMILERLDHIVERQNVGENQRKTLFHDLNDVKSALGVLAAGSPSLEKPPGNPLDRVDTTSDGARGKVKVDGESGEGGGVLVQKGTLRCLTALAQRVSEIAAVVNGIQDTLGAVDNVKGVSAVRKGKMRAFTSPDVALNIPNVGDRIVHGDGSSAENGIDVDALDADEVTSAVGTEPMNDLPQRSLSSTLAERSTSPSDSRRQSGTRIKGRSVMERLDSQQSIIMDIAEWMEKMKDPHADLGGVPQTSTHSEGDAKDSEGDAKVAENNHQFVSSRSSPHRTSAVPPPGCIYSHSSTPSRPGPAGSLSKGGTIQIHIEDHPAATSAALKPTDALDGVFVPVIAPLGVDNKTESDGLHDARQSQGPVVRLFATGNAGVQLLDFAKSIAQAGSGAAIRSLDTEGGVDSMDLDVFESRPNVLGSNSDSDRESSKRSDSSRTLVSEPITTTTLDDMMDQISSSSTSLLGRSKTPRNDTVSVNAHEQPPPPPTIKIKVSRRTVSPAKVAASGSESASSSITSPSKEHPVSYSRGSSSISASQPKTAMTFSSSKFAAATTPADGESKAYPLSPAVWTRTPSGSEALPFDLAQLPTSATPTRSVRVLRSSAPRRSSMPVPQSSATPTPESPSDTSRALRTPRRVATLPLSTPVRVIDANWSSKLKTEIYATEIVTAQRAIEGLLDVQAHTPTKEYALEATSPRIARASPVTPFKIKIPARHPPSRNVSQASIDPTRNTLKQEEDVVAKKVAKRALKGLLKAQAVSLSKQYSIDSSIVPEVEETKPPQMLLPTTNSTLSQETPSTPVTPNRPYALEMQQEGTMSAVRLQDLGHPFVYAGVRVESLQQETQTTHDVERQLNVSPPPQDEKMEAVGTDQPEAPFGSAFMDVDKQMEDTSIQPSRSGSEQSDAPDAPQEDAPESTLADTSGSDEQIPETAPPAKADSDAPSSDAPIVPTTTVVIGTNEPEPDIVEGEASASMERRQSQGLSDLSALTPAPASEAHISAPASRSASVTPPPVDSNLAKLDMLLDFELTSPRVGGSRSSTPIDHSAVAFGEPKTQRTLLDSPEPTIVPDEATGEKPEDSLPQNHESVDYASVIEGSEAIQPPSTASIASPSADQNTSHDLVPIAPTTSQVSSTAEDEEDVQNLMLGHVSSTPIAPSAGHAQETSEFDGAAFADSDDTPKTPTRTHSPMIASSYSPEDMRTLHYDANASLFEGSDGTIPGSQTDMAQVSTEEPTRSPTPPVNSTQTEEPPTSDDVYLGIVDSSPPPVEAAGPESTADEDVLDPEAVLQVKQELDNSTNNGPWTAGVVAATADKGKKKDSTNNAVEAAYIYISDAEQTPVNRPSKKTKRAPSVIYISSDDDIPISQLRSTRNSTDRSDRSAASEAVDASVKVLAIKAEEISGVFADMNGTSTPVRGKTREVSQVVPSREAERSASLAAVSTHSTSRHLLTKELSPVSDLSKSPSPAEQAAKHNDDKRECTAPNEPDPLKESGSAAELKKYIAKIDAEDDIPIIPRKKRKVSAISEVPTEEGPARNTPAESSSAPKKGLLVVPKKGKSTAVTRVKKRKLPTLGPESDEEDQPPLKMAKLRKKSKESETSVKATGSQSKGKVTVSTGAKGKGKMREQPVRSPAKKVKVETPKTPPRLTRGQQARAVKWPHIDRPNFDQFIQCDVCSDWYHIGCVGVGSNDPRLDDSRQYKCPPCEAGVSRHDSESPSKNANNDDPQVYNCSRPKCQRTKKSKKKKTSDPEPASEGSNTFIVEAFIGRFRKVVGGRGKQTFYLVKWHGYPPEECTWEELGQMGIANAATLIDTFEQAAEVEGVDLEQFTDEQALLQEAVDAGWRDTTIRA
ncbi:hypothetical protein HYPSUDRAFT_37645 [Hypholoma sublateritium FD-334 SS-4]|uniref:Chromo domain-containing protein n=1 Tax=Hypholoma sublateritium (strain FD-334 SS-4) TaxID=945553 RepID=A0A0D2PAI9_HYPSF|nr:hypothetical protein HYPSUDRAFT_37645 [Hypholoma sublateritium FD-334 SS-4]